MPGTELERTNPIEIDPPAAAVEPARDNRHLCRHIFTDGRRCGSPALRTQNFCYYHYAYRPHSHHATADGRRKSSFELTRLDGLDNAMSIQLAIAEVATKIASNTIDHKRAGRLLYALQLAGQNLRNIRSTGNAIPVADVVEDPTFGHLAALEPGRTEPETLHSRLQRRTRPFTSYDPPYEVPADLQEVLDHLEGRKELPKPNAD